MSAADVLAGIRAGVQRATARAAHASPRRLARATHLLSFRDAYASAAQVLGPYDPRRHRAELLSDYAAHRALAWTALARGDVDEARRCKALAWRAFRSS